MGRGGRIALVVALALALPSSASGWSTPEDLGSDYAGPPWVDSHGTTRMWLRSKLRFVSWDGTVTKVCKLPRYGQGGSVNMEVNPDGAMVAGWSSSGDRDANLKIFTARAGRCFGKGAGVPAHGGTAGGTVLPAIGRGGTAVATWDEGGNPGHTAYAAGPVGSRLVRRGRLFAYHVDDDHVYSRWYPHVGAGDRVTFTWSTADLTDDERSRGQFWSALTGPGGTPLGEPFVTAKLSWRAGRGGGYLTWPLTRDDGGQVALVTAPAGKIAFAVRRRGERFHRETHIASPRPERAVYAASNSRGDAVFGWDHFRDTYMMYRTHDGRLRGPYLLSPEEVPSEGGRISVAIANSGRAVAAWEAADHELSNVGPTDIKVVTTDRDGRLGTPKVVSSRDDEYDAFPQVGMSPGGRTVVTWTHSRYDVHGAYYIHTWIVHARVR